MGHEEAYWLSRRTGALHGPPLMHYVLYGLLIAAPVSGIILQFARGDSLPLFGLTEIASPWAPDRALARSVKEVHEVTANALVIIAAFHATAALLHHWVLRDRTLMRMLPPTLRS
jgi:cytochrome b561